MDTTTRNQTAPQLLIVEDDAGLAFLLSSTLQESGHTCETVESGRQALEHFQARGCELALLDYSLPDMSANQLVAAARAQGHMPPFIVLTGHGDERVAVELMKLGACDYLLKDATLLPRLASVVARVLTELAVKRQLEEAELALKRSQAELAAIHEYAPVMMVLLDKDRRVRRLNRAALEFSGRTEAQAGELRPGELFGCAYTREDPRGCGFGAHCRTCGFEQTLIDTVLTGANHRRLEVKPKLFFGKETRDVTLLVSTAYVAVGGQPMVLLCLEDVTNQKRLEEQLRQAQKMEAVGQLAGGVAHDFNNILTGMLMYLGLLQSDPALPADTLESLREVENQAKRAASLTRQLLLFSRRQMMQSRPLDLNELLDNMLKMLRRLLGEHVTIEFNSQSDLPWIQADPGMVEQVVMNLCVNARDAMPKGGRLTLSTEPAYIDTDYTDRVPEARPGQFVRFRVRDTGCGMDPGTLSRIFEPFFTTKEVGKGTGLGLATVFGIVKQHQGWLEVQSAPGQGSTFSVLLPVCSQKTAQSREPGRQDMVRGGQETILLVEDELHVRRVTAMALRQQGYQVLEAANGVEALQQWEQSSQPIDLLFSDMVMPEGLTGLDLAEQLRARRPGLKVVLFSGYSAELVGRPGPRTKDLLYLPKPCTREVLVRTVRDCLDRKS